MAKRILAALDGSDRSERSIPWIRRLFPGGEITLLRAIELIFTMDSYPTVFLAQNQKAAEQYLSKVAKKFDPPASPLVKLGSPTFAILDAAQDWGADFVVITTHGGSAIRRRVFGGTAERLIHACPRPLVIVPSWCETPPPSKIRRLLVPLDGSKSSASVLPMAEELARSFGADILLLNCMEEPEMEAPKGNEASFVTALKQVIQERRRATEVELARQAEAMTSRGASARWKVVGGEAYKTILRTIASEDADVLVMSAHGYGAIQRAVIGSVASKVIRESPIPVIVTRFEGVKK